MSKLSYKTLLIIFFSLLIGIVILWKFALPKQKVSAAWWNDGWNYRKAVSIGNTSGSTINDQIVKITTDTSTLITAGKMQSDCDDIRVTDINGNLLDHWDTGCNTTTTNIYFKINTISTTDTTIYIYYGNPSINNDEKTLGTTENPGTSCKMMKDQGSITANGIYYVTPGGNNTDKIQVYCNTSIVSDAWTLVVNNSIYATPPKPTWTNAINAVNITGTFSTDLNSFDLIVGLKHWNYLGNMALIQMGSDSNTITKRAHYSSFSLNTSNNYALSLGGQTIDLGGTAPGFYASHNGQQFTTYDADHDTYTSNCSNSYGNTPWWYHSCWNGSIWGGGDSGGYANKAFWAGAANDYYNYGGIFISGTDTMKSVSAGTLSSEEVGGGPIAYWKFDEGIGTSALNSANNSNTGTITGATWQTEDQCLSGKCLYFNGSSYVNTNFGINRDISINPISVSMWVKPTAAGAYMFLSPNQGTNQRFYFSTYNGKWDMGIQNSGWGGSGSINVDLNKWSHIEIVTTGSTAYMYVNGKITSQKNYTSFTFPENLYIGIHGSSGAYGWVGYIDDVKIYPYARSATQIKQDYNSRGSLNGSSVNLGVKSSTTPSLNSKLVAYYKFDEGSGTTVYDSTTNQNNGTFGTGTSAPTWTNNSKFNKALSFNGSSNYLSTPRIPNITSNQITISAWINPNSISGTQEISNQGQWDGGPWTGWRFQLNSGHISFKLGDGTSIPYTYSAGSISTNNWQQVVGVWDGNYIYIYINGKEVGKSAKSFTYSGNSSTHWIGKYPGTGYFFNGLIDEVKIYNTALTPDEIKQDYNAGAATQFGATNQTIGGTTTSLEYCIPGDASYCTNPIAEWKMDEKTGSTAKDISGNNNNGTITGATWTSGKIGAGLRFDGVDDYVSSGKDLLTSSPTTICTWFKLNTTSQDSAIVGNFASSYWTSYGKGFKYTNGTLYLMCENNNDKETISTSLNDTNWHYACGIIQTSTGKLYLDGAQVASGDLNSDGYNYWTDIGAATWRNTENTKNFNGLIDHIKIYNYARTPAQIAYDYNKGAPVGWWKFDDCQGLTAFDSSGLGNNGAISIGPSGTQNSAGTCQVGTSAAWTNGAIGKYNSSLNFDGTDDYFRINQPNFQTIPNSFTVTGFINPETQSGFLITPRSNGIDQHLGFDNGNQRLVVYIAESSDTNERSRYSTSGSVPSNKWTHFAVSINDKNIKIYINGILNSEYNETINIGGWSSYWYIGQRSNSTNWYKGKMDDLRVYNYPLTTEQIKTVYNNGAVNFQ